MGVEISQITSIGATINRQVQETYKHLMVYYMAHHSGQRAETIAVEEHDLAGHPAGKAALSVLRKKVEGDDTQFLGLSASTEKAYFGLASQCHLIGLVTVNADRYASAQEAREHMYQLAWHAIDLAEIREKPEFKEKFSNGPMVPKRSPLNLAKANLRADVFGAVMMALQGDASALKKLGARRGHAVLSQASDFRAEDYPYVIALEAAQFALAEATKTLVPKNRLVKLARRISEDVGQTFDDAAIRQWWAFSGPAQDMAWRGYSKEQILGAAINTGEDAYVRSVGMLVAEITGLSALSSSELAGCFNAFNDDEINARAHREAADEVFEGAVAQVMFENNSKAFLAVANEQNQSLADGRLLGWCAAALQAAAKAFENALANGKSPTQAARLEFEGTRNVASWPTLRQLGEKIVEKRRDSGRLLGMSDVTDLCRQNPDCAPILASVQMTAQDPAIKARLQAATDLIPASMPKLSQSFGPKMSASAPSAAPAHQFAPSGPGFGGPGSSSSTRPARRVASARGQEPGEDHAAQDSQDERVT